MNAERLGQLATRLQLCNADGSRISHGTTTDPDCSSHRFKSDDLTGTPVIPGVSNAVFLSRRMRGCLGSLVESDGVVLGGYFDMERRAKRSGEFHECG